MKEEVGPVIWVSPATPTPSFCLGGELGSIERNQKVGYNRALSRPARLPRGTEWEQERNARSHFPSVPFSFQNQGDMLPWPPPPCLLPYSHQVTANRGRVLPLKCYQWTNPANPGSHQPCHSPEWPSAQWHSKAGPNRLWVTWTVRFTKYIYLSQWLWVFPDRVSRDEWLLGGRTNRSTVPRSINR